MEFFDYLDIADSKLNNIESYISKMKKYANNGMYEDLVETSFRLCKESESFTELTRLLPIYTGTYGAKELVEDIIIDTLEINIDEDDYFTKIHLNALLPKKEKERAGYIRTALISALDRYNVDNPIKPITEPVVIVFSHNYSDDKRMWRDHDNIEINVVVDALALYFLIDDTSMLCDHFYFSNKSTEDSTDVYLVKQKDFPKFIQEFYKKKR